MAGDGEGEKRSGAAQEGECGPRARRRAAPAPRPAAPRRAGLAGAEEGQPGESRPPAPCPPPPPPAGAAAGKSDRLKSSLSKQLNKSRDPDAYYGQFSTPPRLDGGATGAPAGGPAAGGGDGSGGGDPPSSTGTTGIPELDALVDPPPKKRNPLVLVGSALTAAVLLRGILAMRQGNSHLSAKMMNWRIYGQGATVAVILASMQGWDGSLSSAGSLFQKLGLGGGEAAAAGAAGAGAGAAGGAAGSKP